MSAPAATAGGRREDAGLVPFKTSRETTVIVLAPSCVAERRVNRLKRSVWASGHLHGLANAGFRPPVAWFVTLTYAGVDDWRADHIAKAIERFRSWCSTQGVLCRYTWVAELQRRGAVHYHLLAWLPPGVVMPKWDRSATKRRSPFWNHGMSNTERAKSGVGYLMKYLSKLGDQTRFPRGLRLYGIGGLNDDGKQVRQWHNLPQWAKSAYGVGELARSAFGLVVRATGEILPAVWKVSRVPGALHLQKLREVLPRFPELAAVGEWPGAFSTFPRSGA